MDIPLRQLAMLVGGAFFAGGTLAAGAALLIRRRRSRGRRSRWEQQIEELEEEVLEVGTENRGLARERQQSAADVASGKARITALEAELASVSVKLSNAADDVSRAEKRAATAVTELNDAQSRDADVTSMEADLTTRTRELRLVSEQRNAIARKLEEMVRGKLDTDAERARLELQVDTLDQQLQQAAEFGKAERSRLETSRAILATQVLDQKRQIDAARRSANAAEAERDVVRVDLARALARLEEADANLRLIQVGHQEELARTAAQIGALMAQAERLDPLRHQIADREGLIRSLAHERDEASTLAVKRERELTIIAEKHDLLIVELRRISARLVERDRLVAELESRAAAAVRQRDDSVASERGSQARIDSLKAEIRERDLRFKALLADRRSLVETGQSEVARLREDLTRLRMAGPAVAVATNGDGPDSEQPGDDLQRISGIGPAIERALRHHGVRTFRQIATWTDVDIDRLSAVLGNLRVRIKRDRWVEQARLEHERSYGEHID